MLNSPVLDLVILLAFTYFIGSLLLSTINESISQGLFRLRQGSLKKALEGLFFDPSWKEFIKNRFIKSPHIQSLMREEDRYPAYIPSNNFILALIGILGSENYIQGNLQKAIAGADLPGDFKKILMDIAAKADNKLEDFEKGLTAFYNDAMERAAGRYKKKIRLLLLILGFILAATFNLDTIKIANDALNDKQQLKATADKIAATLPSIKLDKDSLITIVTIKDAEDKVLITQKASLDTMVNKTADAKGIKSSIESFQSIQLIYEETTSLHLGYLSWDDFCNQWFRGGYFFIKLLGVLITAFALQLGSNYWFDLLNKAVNIRGVGRKPEEPGVSNK